MCKSPSRPGLAKLNGCICCIKAWQAGLVFVDKNGLDVAAIRSALPA